jgi:hypothetical protein
MKDGSCRLPFGACDGFFARAGGRAQIVQFGAARTAMPTGRN